MLRRRAPVRRGPLPHSSLLTQPGGNLDPFTSGPLGNHCGHSLLIEVAKRLIQTRGQGGGGGYNVTPMELEQGGARAPKRTDCPLKPRQHLSRTTWVQVCCVTLMHA